MHLQDSDCIIQLRYGKIRVYIDLYEGEMNVSSWKKEYHKWVTHKDLDPILKQDLADLKGNNSLLEEAFHQELAFGTGGVRGILGPGTNRLNQYTVRKSINGLANHLKSTQTDYKERGVVVAYDSRYMSEAFSLEVARVLGVHGIKTYIFTTLHPTPLLSFAVRHLQTVAGVMITASHNPPEYNGFKVYNEDGGQLTLEEASEVIAAIKQSEDGLTVPVMGEQALEDKERLYWVGHDIDQAYLKELARSSKLDAAAKQEPKDVSIVFTPLHGTGFDLVMKGLQQLQFNNVHVVEEQIIPDPEFSTVTSPNPEEPQAFALAIEQGKQHHADILLATDPDADRLGVAVKDGQGEYVVLTGNQIGVLLLDYLLSHSDASQLENGRVLKTIVTTELGKAIAEEYGVEIVNTLTGFKFISEKIRQYEETGEQFLFGFEESYGFLISSISRDKDAIQATTMICEVAEYWKKQDKTLLDALNLLYEKHGFYVEGITQLTLKGIEGTAQIEALMQHFRDTPRSTISGFHIEKVEDYLTSKRTVVGDVNRTEPIHLPKENVIKFLLEGDRWVCLRPSGTEPKIKCYYGVCGESHTESNAELADLQTTMEQIMNEVIEKD